MPVYRVPFRLKFLTVSGHMIKCLLTEFGGASGENIKLRVMKKGPRCAPTTPSISTQYFGFVRHTFITHDVIEHEKWKVLFFFNRKCQVSVFTPLKGLIFITRSTTVQPKSIFFLTLSYLCVIMDSLSSWTFHFLAGVICMIEAKTTKKKPSDCNSVLEVTLL